MAYSNHAQSHTQIGTGHRKRNRSYELRVNVYTHHIPTNHITTHILTYCISTHYTQSSPPNKTRKTIKHVSWTRDEIEDTAPRDDVQSLVSIAPITADYSPYVFKSKRRSESQIYDGKTDCSFYSLIMRQIQIDSG